MEELGIYIHIPFCKQKCFYCDFCSFANKNEMQGKYDEIRMEFKNKKLEQFEKDIEKKKIAVIGIGVSNIPLIDYLHEKKAEVSVFDDREEDKISKDILEKLKKYKEYGINRLSIGLQSANDKILKKIGRIHDYKQFEETFFYARKCGFKNINVDLMIGLPTQAVEDVKQTLEKIIQKNPEHISVYSLIIEEGTIIEKLINENKLQLPDEETERMMYWTVVNELKENGYNQYEISNFSKKT